MIDFATNELVVSDLCDIYAIESDEWNILPSLNVRRSNACCCFFKDRYIYVFGGDVSTHYN